MSGADKTPVTVNGYRISFDGEQWQAVKNHVVCHRNALKQAVVNWAKHN